MGPAEIPAAYHQTSHPIPNSLGFPARQDVIDTAERLAALSHAIGSERFGMVIAPGVVRLVTGDSALDTGAAFSTRPDPVELAAKPSLTESRPQPREPIAAWSQKSRSRMIRVFAELDYSPLLTSGRLPAMITLTYPGDWLAVAPDAVTVKRVHFKALAKRWQRAWGSPLRCVWKLEFQRRGAPHLHLFTVPPMGRSSSRFAAWSDLEFPTWLSKTWADIVDHPDEVQRRNHELAGTGIDYADAVTARDPKRLAIYFAKHAAPSAASSKEFQHSVPPEWIAAGKTPGRFWGKLGLEPATADVALTEREFIVVRRTLRRWSSRTATYPAGSKYPSAVRPTMAIRRIPVVDPKTGEVKRYRNVRRRSSLLGGGRLVGGFVVANNGVRLAQLASRIATESRTSTLS